MAVVMAVMVFAVSNLLFLGDREVDMSVYCIRTLVDFCGVLILTVQHEQLREAALHSELAAMDEVLHRQYEQYKRSKEGIRLINSRCHELKIQIADIRAERDRAKQDAALARMESGIRQYEAENKTGNPVLDTLLTAKSMDCQQRGINMTSVADGSQLGFLSTRELCTLVGAPLDNAIESVLAESDPEKRLLRVAIYNQSGCVMLRFENYCAPGQIIRKRSVVRIRTIPDKCPGIQGPQHVPGSCGIVYMVRIVMTAKGISGRKAAVL